MNLRILFSVLIVVLAVSVGIAEADDGAPVFKVYVEHSGIYEVRFERLQAAGFDGPLASARIGLSNRGTPVPVWIEDGGDGVFGPGDRLLFAGDVLRGEFSYLNPYSRFNCYVLSTSVSEPLRGENIQPSADSTGHSAALMAHHRLEPDRVMVRFRSRTREPEEEWYWERISVADKNPFEQVVTFDGLVRQRSDREQVPGLADELAEWIWLEEREPGADSPQNRSLLDVVVGGASTDSTVVRIRLGLRGWSEPRHAERASLPHHELEVLFNGRPVSTANWDGTDHHVHEFEIPATSILSGDNNLALKIVKRMYPESGDLLVDVVLLNWIELEYEHRPVISDRQARLRLAEPAAGRLIEISSEDAETIDLYLSGGRRLRSDGVLVAEIPEDLHEFSVLESHSAAEPAEVVLDRPSDLRNTQRQIDYIMVTHRSLEEGAQRLAEFHRSRGLAVEIVDVHDIYDEFNHGIISPHAVKDFLEYAHTEWQSPAPRFVLLIGDASWDFKNTTADDSNYADWSYRPWESRSFAKNQSTSYAEGAELNHRNLVPTSSYLTLEGHAASDTWFVCFDEDEKLPEMAIGRIPVVTPEELDHVIDKTIAYASQPPIGPWRRNLLFIANESVGFQRRTDTVAESYSRRGYVPTKIYPHPSEPANEHHTRRIIEAFDDGVYAVHFIGHGGRYIWRTGPPDLEKNHDLFTLDHLDQLNPNGRIPVVLSLTCYSAPFDHPTADSIGEKLLRVPDRGAIGVFAASWRNSPSPVMGETLLAELTMPGNTIGEAIMRAKREFRSQVLIQTYNLLGDPAVPVGAPTHTLDLELESDPGGGGVTLRAKMPTESGSYDVIADWVGVEDSVLRRDTVTAGGGQFELTLESGVIEGAEALAGVRVYVWDEEQRVDGIGWAESPTEEIAAVPTEGARDASAELRQSKGES